MQQAQRHAWRRLQLSRPRGAPHGHYVRGLAQLSRTSTQLPRSGIRDVMEQASAREENGERIIHLEVGQPDLLPPQHVQEASAASALAPERSGSARYCPNPGVADARAAAAEYFERRAPGVRTLPEQIMVTPGAVMAIAATYACVLDAGDEVLVPDPGWPNYRMAAELYNATPVSYACPAEDGWLPNVDQMADAVTNKTRLLLLNNPSNPAGVCLPPPLLAEILAMAHEKDLFVLSDEIYSDLAPPGEASPPSVLSYDMSEEDQERLIVVSGVSKAYSMCGYRVGFLRAQPALIDTANKVVETLISCTSPASQAGMVAALRGPQVRTMLLLLLLCCCSCASRA